MPIKYTKTLLDSYCKENNIELKKDYSNENISCSLSLIGKCTNCDCVNNFQKSFKNLLKNGSLCRQCNLAKNNKRKIFNWKLLEFYCSDKNIKFDKDFSKEKLTVDTILSGICENNDCEKKFECNFRSLIKTGALCDECFYKKRTDVTKKTNKDRYGVEFVSQVKEFREKAEDTMLEKYGVKFTLQSDILYDKMVKNNQEKYGVDNVSQIYEVREKAMETMEQIYGVKHASQNIVLKKKAGDTMEKRYGKRYSLQVEEFKEKAKETNLQRFGKPSYLGTVECKEITKQKCLDEYGVDHYSKVPEIKQKVEDTNLKRFGKKSYLVTDECREITKQKCLKEYGVDHYTKTPEIKQKIEDTMVSNFGVKSVFQIPYVKEKTRKAMIEQKDEIVVKRKQTSLQNWGTEYPMQNSELAEKASENAYKLKEYKFPSGRIVKVQGYEPFALDELYVENINENDIILGRRNVPEIWFNDKNGKKHRHYVDIFIPSQNRCIEIKSTWTAENKKNCIFLKQEAGKQLGYTYEIWVYNRKGEKVECYK